MAGLPGYSDPGNVDDGDILDPNWGDDVRSGLNIINGILGKKYVAKAETTQAAVVNTTTETAVATYTVPGNTLGASGVIIRAFAEGIVKNASGGNINLVIRLKYGSTTITSDTIGVNNGDDYPVRLEFALYGIGATDSQRGNYFRQVKGSTDGYYGAAAEDSTGDLDLELTVQWASADPDAELDIDFAIFELIQE